MKLTSRIIIAAALALAPAAAFAHTNPVQVHDRTPVAHEDHTPQPHSKTPTAHH
jgi:hypothetical protein